MLFGPEQRRLVSCIRWARRARARLAYLVSSAWALGLEHYADFGPIERFDPPRRQIYYSGKSLDIDGGIGCGLTSGSNDWIVKSLLEWAI